MVSTYYEITNLSLFSWPLYFLKNRNVIVLVWKSFFASRSISQYSCINTTAIHEINKVNKGHSIFILLSSSWSESKRCNVECFVDIRTGTFKRICVWFIRSIDRPLLQRCLSLRQSIISAQLPVRFFGPQCVSNAIFDVALEGVSG